MLTVTDVSTTCAEVIFRVKVICIRSVAWYLTLVVDLIAQLSGIRRIFFIWAKHRYVM